MVLNFLWWKIGCFFKLFLKKLQKTRIWKEFSWKTTVWIAIVIWKNSKTILRAPKMTDKKLTFIGSFNQLIFDVLIQSNRLERWIFNSRFLQIRQVLIKKSCSQHEKSFKSKIFISRASMNLTLKLWSLSNLQWISE